MTRYLSFKDIRRRLRENFVSSAIFLISIAIFIYLLQEPISLTIFIPCYILLLIFLRRFVKIFYGKEKFLLVYRVVLHPITSLLVLFIIFIIDLSPYTLFAGLIWIFSLSLFASFVAHAWLNSLRKGEYSFQTVQIYRQARFKNYFLGVFIILFVMIILVLLHPILSTLTILFWFTYFTYLMYYFLFASLGTSRLSFISEDDVRRYCEMGLTEVINGLEFYGKGGYREKKIFIKKYLPIFPTLITLINNLAEEDYPDLLPHVPDTEIYKKALFASVIKDRPRLKETRKGIERMIKALKVGKPRKSNFIGFIKGLCVVAGKKTDFSNVPEAFKIKPSLGKSLSKIRRPEVLAGIIAVLITLSSVYVTVRVSAPEAGYNWAKGVFGEDFAKLLFPIGEAIIVNPMHYTEVIQTGWSGEDRLNGRGRGEYSFQVSNRHFRKIMITNINITGPEPITRVYASNGTSYEVGAENINFEIENILIESPSEPIIFEEFIDGTVVVTLKVRYDLRALRSVLEEEKPAQLIIFGWVQISVLYEFKGLRENISENVNVNFILPTAFFLE